MHLLQLRHGGQGKINNYSLKVFPKGAAVLVNDASESDCVFLHSVCLGFFIE